MYSTCCSSWVWMKLYQVYRLKIWCVLKVDRVLYTVNYSTGGCLLLWKWSKLNKAFILSTMKLHLLTSHSLICTWLGHLQSNPTINLWIKETVCSTQKENINGSLLYVNEHQTVLMIKLKCTSLQWSLTFRNYNAIREIWIYIRTHQEQLYSLHRKKIEQKSTEYQEYKYIMNYIFRPKNCIISENKLENKRFSAIKLYASNYPY